jgi:hypothetical protein
METSRYYRIVLEKLNCDQLRLEPCSGAAYLHSSTTGITQCRKQPRSNWLARKRLPSRHWDRNKLVEQQNSRTRTTTRRLRLGLIALYRLRLLIYQERLHPGKNFRRHERHYRCDSLPVLQS